MFQHVSICFHSVSKMIKYNFVSLGYPEREREKKRDPEERDFTRYVISTGFINERKKEYSSSRPGHWCL